MKTLLLGVLLSRKQIPTYVIWNASRFFPTIGGVVSGTPW
jgi:hypothetical protein